MMNQYGLGLEAIDTARTVALEPALAPARDKLGGAIYAPGDESGDCRRFTEELAHLCGTMGVIFRLGTTIKRLVDEGELIASGATDYGDVTAEPHELGLGTFNPP